MNEQTEKILNEQGWRVDCYSPLEITLISDDLESPTEYGTATGDAARFIIDVLIEEHTEEPAVDRIIPQMTYEQWLLGQILAGSASIAGKRPSEIAARAAQIVNAATTQ